MKERPIIFSAPMIIALLDGAKTQTRRIVKLPANAGKVHVDPGGTDVFGPGPYLKVEVRRPGNGPSMHPRIYCPYGYPGDRLWVRETWCRPCWDAYEYITDDRPRGEVIDGVDLREAVFYKATDPDVVNVNDEDRSPWKSPIFMPRWASRILLVIVSVRVERIQDISETDAIAEGVDARTLPGDYWPMSRHGSTFRNGFKLGWQTINGEASWIKNPLVWAVTFKALKHFTPVQQPITPLASHGIQETKRQRRHG